MVKILFILLLLFINSNNSYEISHNITDNTNSIEPGISKTFYIEYIKKHNFTFNTTKSDPLQINILSINCKIDAWFESEEKINSINTNKNHYHFVLDSKNKSFLIEPVKDTSEGFYDERYELKTCFLSLNSYYVINNTQQNLQIANKEENFLYFNSLQNNQINISYYLNNLSNNSFVALNFRFEESSFQININYNNETNKVKPISKNIDSSTYIYLNNTYLSYNNYSGGILYITITNNNNNNKNKTASLIFKIIEENNTCLLTKNALNFGFITSKSTYQYYYTDILSEEEGEFMLHNKRLYGVLYAKIVNKSDINYINDLYYNTSLYPHKNEENDTVLDYNEHRLQLKFNYINHTYGCKNGCYILITYEQTKSEEYFPLIGYEYTILSRTWNFTDGSFKLIEIFSNEYIVGCYDLLSPFAHFYLIHIPNDTKKIIIQTEGTYIEAFYKYGKHKINSWYQKGFNEIEFDNNKNVMMIDKADTTSEYITFLFNIYESYYIEYSHYYFRVLFIKNDAKSKYLPIDSNLGNLCLPERKNNEANFYCNLILKNDYNELDFVKFAISTENRNEIVKIKATIFDENNLELKNNNTNTNFIYVYDVYDEMIKNINYILFEFEFDNNETKNIISSFSDRIKTIYPQIYSGQMCYLDKFEKINNLKYSNDSFMKYQFVYGDSGVYNYSIEEYDYIKISHNFKGKTITIPLDKSFSFYTNNTKHIFFYQLIYDLKYQVLDEVKEGEPLIRVLNEYYVPLYYYIKIKSKNYANIDVNIGFKIYAEYPNQINPQLTIKGYVINEKSFNRILMDEFTELENPIDGTYSDAFGIGFLEVNKKLENNDSDNYLIVEIGILDRFYSYKNTSTSVEVSYKEYDDFNNNTNYSLPVNKYIIESIYGKNSKTRNENKYRIDKNENIQNPILIEISTQNDNIELVFENNLLNKNITEDKSVKGFNKYMIEGNQEIKFKVKNNGTNKSNYLIKYSYYDEDEQKSFIFDVNDYKLDGDNYTWKFIQVNTTSEVLKNKGAYFFITGTLYNASDASLKSLSSNYILNKYNFAYVNKTTNYFNLSEKSENNNWTLEFKEVPKLRDCNYNLQLQIHALPLDNFLNEEYLLYKKETILIKNIENKKWIYIAIFVPIGVIILAIALFFLIKYFRLKKKSDSFTQEMKSLLFSNDLQKNVLIHEQQLSKNDSDYENTFI